MKKSIILTISLSIVLLAFSGSVFMAYKNYKIKKVGSDKAFSGKVKVTNAVTLPVPACENAQAYQAKIKCVLDENNLSSFNLSDDQETFEALLTGLGGEMLGATLESILETMGFNHSQDGLPSQNDFIDDLMVKRLNSCIQITESPCTLSSGYVSYLNDPTAYTNTLTALNNKIDEAINPLGGNQEVYTEKEEKTSNSGKISLVLGAILATILGVLYYGAKKS